MCFLKSWSTQVYLCIFVQMSVGYDMKGIMNADEGAVQAGRRK